MCTATCSTTITVVIIIHFCLLLLLLLLLPIILLLWLLLLRLLLLHCVVLYEFFVMTQYDFCRIQHFWFCDVLFYTNKCWTDVVWLNNSGSILFNVQPKKKWDGQNRSLFRDGMKKKNENDSNKWGEWWYSTVEYRWQLMF